MTNTHVRYKYLVGKTSILSTGFLILCSYVRHNIVLIADKPDIQIPLKQQKICSTGGYLIFYQNAGIKMWETSHFCFYKCDLPRENWPSSHLVMIVGIPVLNFKLV